MLLEIYTLLGNTEEFWKFVMRNRLRLTKEQFELAITGKRIVNDDLTKAAKMVLVDGEEVGEVAKQLGIGNSNVSNKVTRVLENLTKQLEKHGMTLKTSIIDNEYVSIIDTFESKSFQRVNAKSRKR